MLNNSIRLIEGYQVNSVESKTRIRKKLLKKTYKIPLDFFTNEKRPRLVTSFKNLYTDTTQILKSKAGIELKLKPEDIIINDETKTILETLLFSSDKEDTIQIITKYLGSGVIAAHEDFVIFLHQPNSNTSQVLTEPISSSPPLPTNNLPNIELRIYMSTDNKK
jgi:hypothetical protein